MDVDVKFDSAHCMSRVGKRKTSELIRLNTTININKRKEHLKIWNKFHVNTTNIIVTAQFR